MKESIGKWAAITVISIVLLVGMEFFQEKTRCDQNRIQLQSSSKGLTASPNCISPVKNPGPTGPQNQTNITRYIFLNNQTDKKEVYDINDGYGLTLSTFTGTMSYIGSDTVLFQYDNNHDDFTIIFSLDAS
jgi:hypothetical protein